MMKTIGTCKDCKQSELFLSEANEFGGGLRYIRCNSNKFDDEIIPHADELSYCGSDEYSEGGEFWVGPDFGCIHWTPKERNGAVVNTELMLKELADLYGECQHQNWDGHDSMPVTKEVYELSKRFISEIPHNIPCPRLGAEPDGSITFEWYYSDNCFVSISIWINNLLVYVIGVGNHNFSGHCLVYKND